MIGVVIATHAMRKVNVLYCIKENKDRLLVVYSTVQAELGAQLRIIGRAAWEWTSESSISRSVEAVRYGLGSLWFDDDSWCRTPLSRSVIVPRHEIKTTSTNAIGAT